MRCKSSISIMMLFFIALSPTLVRAQGLANFLSNPSMTEQRSSSIQSSTFHKRSATRRKPANDLKAAEKRGFKRVSDLTNFPRFFPSLGFVFVKPATLPTGPYLSFDRQNRLVATTYMLSLKEMNEHKKFEVSGMTKPVDHTTVYYNGGHPGVMMPHYHVVAWHVSKAAEARVAK